MGGHGHADRPQAQLLLQRTGTIGWALGDVVARKSAGQPYVTAVAPRQSFPDLFAAGRALCCCELTDPVPPRAHEKLLYAHSSLRDVLARATC